MRTVRAVVTVVSIFAVLAPPGRAAQSQQPTAAPVPDRLHFTLNDLPKRERNPAAPSEIADVARRRGFDYVADTRKAALGDVLALKRFFQIAEDADGAAAESISGVPTMVYHLLGDEKFAGFLAAQTVPYQVMVRNRILSDGPSSDYLSRYFPRTTRVLFRGEMTGWVSPNGLFAIRKTFTDGLALAGSKVERAGVIDKKTGALLVDVTADDIGTGAQREGEVFWSPDSQRVALLSTDISVEQGNPFDGPPPVPLRKQTVVYQRSGDTFVRVGLALSEPPDRATDKDVPGAILMHIYTEPVRWVTASVLTLRRHEYYRKMSPTTVDKMVFNSIHDLARQYQITVTFRADGRASARWTRVDRVR